MTSSISLRAHARLARLVAASAAALACAAQPAAAAVSVSGQVNAGVEAQINNVAAIDTHSASFTGAPATLTTSASATKTAPGFNVDHHDHVSAFGSVTATWASANSGSVDFTNYGWDFNIGNPANQITEADLDTQRPGPDWSYTFTAVGNGVLVMDYDVVGTGTVFGLQGWNIFLTPGGAPDYLTGNPDPIADPTQSGVYSANLVAGQTYTIELDNNANVADGNFTKNFSGSMNGTFDWTIRDGLGVPEPANWALMMVGFFGLGGLLRNRRRLPWRPDRTRENAAAARCVKPDRATLSG